MAQPALEIGPHRPACSVIICAYNSARRIDRALAALDAQDMDECYEVIAVVSGDDSTAERLACRHPSVRVIRSDERLYPGAARNAGIRASRGQIIAFVPDDGVADPRWLRLRLAKHCEGYPLVAGAISNATPRSIIGTAGYYVEYAGSMPVEGLLERQPIPHTVSYDRHVFEQIGGFPEIDHAGEDTVFNQRCIAAELRVGYEPHSQIGHINLTSFRAFLSHQRDHGRGLVRCIAEHDLDGPACRSGSAQEAWWALASYPAWRWRATLSLVAHAGARDTVRFLALTPLIAAGYLAGGLGALGALRASGEKGIGARDTGQDHRGCFAESRRGAARSRGRRRAQYKALRRLHTGVRLDFFAAVLRGPPTLSREVDLNQRRAADATGSLAVSSFREHLFVERAYCVQAIADDRETVVAFSVTARTPQFRALLRVSHPEHPVQRARTVWRQRLDLRPRVKVKLNHTRFADATRVGSSGSAAGLRHSATPVPSCVWAGARAWGYSELHQLGPPGHPEVCVLSATSAGPYDQVDLESLRLLASPLAQRFDDGKTSLTSCGKRFRRSTVVTTYTMLDRSVLTADDYARNLTFGPHGDEVCALG